MGVSGVGTWSLRWWFRWATTVNHLTLSLSLCARSSYSRSLPGPLPPSQCPLPSASNMTPGPSEVP